LESLADFSIGFTGVHSGNVACGASLKPAIVGDKISHNSAKSAILPARSRHSKCKHPNGDPALKLQLSRSGDTKLFTAHGDDYVSVNDERFTSSIVVSSDQVRSDWIVSDFTGLNEGHFAYLAALKPDVLLLGTGSTQQFPHPRLYRALTDAGIGLECMDTPAACRTYNILVAENRKVVAAILL
jgi:uncharacterized protein